MARADRRRAVREARHTQHRPMAQRERAMAEQEMFFPKLRKQARWVFALLAVVFAGGFVFLGVGSGSSVGDLLQGNWSDLFGGSGSTADKDADKAREQIAKHPDDAQAYRDLATALEAGKHPDEAIAPLEKYRALRPKDTDALGELASLYLTKADRARLEATNVQQQAGAAGAATIFTPDPSSKIGQAYSGSADPLTGADPINKAVQTLVNDRASKSYSAMTAAYKKAVSVYKSITSATPRDPNAWFQLAQASEASSDTASAITAYKRFLELAPDDPNAAAVRQRLKQLQTPQPAPQAGG
jgi:tetratricopeptide (TPR) repeat protein